MATITEEISLTEHSYLGEPSPGPTVRPSLEERSTGNRLQNEEPAILPSRMQSKSRVFFVVFQLCMINFLGSFTSGIITVGLPTIASALSIPTELYIWPTSVYGLASGATIMLAGAIADHVGARYVEFAGTLVLSVFILACGWAKTGVQLIVFRALQGVGLSMHVPAAISLVAAAVPPGKARNISFGCLGLSQPLGFSAGLVASGIMIEKAGWRMGFYLSGAACLLASLANFWYMLNPNQQPPSPTEGTCVSSMLIRLGAELDWIGSFLASAGLALLSYALSVISAELSAIHKTSTILMLVFSVLLVAMFPLWMHQRERSGKRALIPNALWKKTAFASTCLMLTLSNGAMYPMTLFSSLYFQKVQGISAFSTSIRLLPSLVVGICTNLCVGIIVDRLPARWLVAVSSLLCACGPMLMALAKPQLPYWNMELPAQILAPLSSDVLYTVGLLVVSEEFPEDTQALAGAVFSTVSLFGSSLGLAICQVVALTVSNNGNASDGTNSGDLLNGYRASFWTMFALLTTCSLLAVGGLRKSGKIGLKKD